MLKAPFAQHVERNEAVGTDAEVRSACGQQLRHIHARAAFENANVESFFGVKAQRLRFVEAAMLGLRFPVGDKGDVRGCCRAGA